MEWKGKYKSEILMVCHMNAVTMHESGAISDKEMREYDKDCLVSHPKPTSDGLSIPNHKPVPAYADSQRP
jgi:DNA-binding transcriptional regulator YiaG